MREMERRSPSQKRSKSLLKERREESCWKSKDLAELKARSKSLHGQRKSKSELKRGEEVGNEKLRSQPELQRSKSVQRQDRIQSQASQKNGMNREKGGKKRSQDTRNLSRSRSKTTQSTTKEKLRQRERGDSRSVEDGSWRSRSQWRMLERKFGYGIRGPREKIGHNERKDCHRREESDNRGRMGSKDGRRSGEGSQQWGRELEGERRLDESLNGAKAKRRQESGSEVNRGEMKKSGRKEWLVGEVQKLEKAVREKTAKRQKRLADESSVAEVSASERNKALILKLGKKYENIGDENKLEGSFKRSQCERKVDFCTGGAADKMLDKAASAHSELLKSEVQRKMLKEGKEVYGPEVPRHSRFSSADGEEGEEEEESQEKEEGKEAISSIRDDLAKIWVKRVHVNRQQIQVRSRMASLKVAQLESILYFCYMKRFHTICQVRIVIFRRN